MNGMWTCRARERARERVSSQEDEVKFDLQPGVFLPGDSWQEVLLDLLFWCLIHKHSPAEWGSMWFQHCRRPSQQSLRSLGGADPAARWWNTVQGDRRRHNAEERQETRRKKTSSNELQLQSAAVELKLCIYDLLHIVALLYHTEESKLWTLASCNISTEGSCTSPQWVQRWSRWSRFPPWCTGSLVVGSLHSQRCHWCRTRSVVEGRTHVLSCGSGLMFTGRNASPWWNLVTTSVETWSYVACGFLLRRCLTAACRCWWPPRWGPASEQTRPSTASTRTESPATTASAAPPASPRSPPGCCTWLGTTSALQDTQEVAWTWRQRPELLVERICSFADDQLMYL